MSPLVAVARRLPVKVSRNLMLVWISVITTVTLILVIREALR